MKLNIGASMFAPCGINCGVFYAPPKKKKPCGGAMSLHDTQCTYCAKAFRPEGSLVAENDQ